MAPREIPIIGFSGKHDIEKDNREGETDASHPGFLSSDATAKQAVVDQIRESCLYNGFLQIKNHRIDLAKQRAVMENSKKFFEMPFESKETVSKNNNSWNRGYEMLRSQILEEGTEPELKEGFYIGAEIPKTHPYFIEKKLNSGPNQWPEALGDDLPAFQQATMDYYNSALALAGDLMRAIALSLDLDELYFDRFLDGAVATMRLLHYPPQPADCDDKKTRGIGAHTDFGAITMLLQDVVDGLQVWDQESKTWIDVSPLLHFSSPCLFHGHGAPVIKNFQANIIIDKASNSRYPQLRALS